MIKYYECSVQLYIFCYMHSVGLECYTDYFLKIYYILLYLLVSMCAVIGQFSGPYSPVRPAKI